MGRRDRIDEEDRDHRGEEEGELRRPDQGYVERAAHHGEEEEQQGPWQPSDSPLEFEKHGDEPQESDEADRQGHDVEVCRASGTCGQDF